MPMTPEQMVKLLKKNGFEKVSQNGSHLKMQNPKTKAIAIIPMHAKDIPIGTEKSILKQAGLKK